MINMIFLPRNAKKHPKNAIFPRQNLPQCLKKWHFFSDSVPSQLKAKSLSQSEHHKDEKKA